MYSPFNQIGCNIADGNLGNIFFKGNDNHVNVYIIRYFVQSHTKILLDTMCEYHHMICRATTFSALQVNLHPSFVLLVYNHQNRAVSF